MKKLLLALTLVALPSMVEAQEVYSISATANQVTRITRANALTARRTCLRLGLAEGCTQAQACVAANAAGGASCTAAQARAANARIYPITQAGREEFITFEFIVKELKEFDAEAVRRDQDLYCIWFKAQNQATQNAECSKISSVAECKICQ